MSPNLFFLRRPRRPFLALPPPKLRLVAGKCSRVWSSRSFVNNGLTDCQCHNTPFQKSDQNLEAARCFYRHWNRNQLMGG